MVCCALSGSPACSTRPSNHLQSRTGEANQQCMEACMPKSHTALGVSGISRSHGSQDMLLQPTYGLCVPPGLQQGRGRHEMLGKHRTK